MPKLHPSYYSDDTQDNLFTAVDNMDGDKVYESLKAGAVAKAEHLQQILINPGYDVYKATFSYCSPKVELADIDRELNPSISWAEPTKMSEDEFNDLHQDITETLLMRSAPALGKIPAMNHGEITTPADMAFTSPISKETEFLGSRSAVVLMALAGKGDWTPNLSQAFRNQIGVDDVQEDRQRSELAQHSTQLITEITRRMDDPHDMFGRLARSSVEAKGRMNHWKSELPAALQTPEKFPRPTEAARELFMNGYKRTYEKAFGRPMNMSLS